MSQNYGTSDVRLFQIDLVLLYCDDSKMTYKEV